MLAGTQSNWNSHILLVAGMQNGTDALENILAVYHKVKYKLIVCPSRCTVGIYPGGMKPYVHGTCIQECRYQVGLHWLQTGSSLSVH